MVISDNEDFLKHCVYEERSVEHFNMKWQELLATYDLGHNSWLQNLYSLREKWATVYRRDSFCADMTSTQRSEAAESYTRNMYIIFEEEFKNQFVLSCTLLTQEGTVSTYKIMSMEWSWDEAIVTFNSDDMHVVCSCKKYDCSGILCKHILRAFNHNNIIILPPSYILSKWTKYAKRGTFSKTRQLQSDNLSAQSALLSRKMISVALKCAVSKTVLQHLDDGFDKLTLEVENLLSQMNLNEKEAPQCLLKCTQEVAEERISFRVPPHKKGPMVERSKSVLEGGKKNGSSKKEERKMLLEITERKTIQGNHLQQMIQGNHPT